MDGEGQVSEKRRAHNRGHVLLVPFPAQGHVTPSLQLGKRLASHGVTTTIAITRYLAKSTPPKHTLVTVEQISDGHDDGGRDFSKSTEAYFEGFKISGSETLAQLISDLGAKGSPVDCVVYDPFIPWALDVAKDLGLPAAAFFTQACAVCAIYYHAYHGHLPVPPPGPNVSLDGLPLLGLADVSSFISVPGHYPAYLKVLLNQFSNLEKADFVFFNTFHDLESQVMEWMATVYPARSIGPMVPSMYLDKRVEGDDQYGFNLYKSNDDVSINNWLDSKQTGSVVYTSFGSFAALVPEQMEEIAWGLRKSNKNFLWVVRAEEESKLPNNFIQETREKGLVAKWCSQLEVLAHRAVGCFVTHCGWNSTTEALSLGVPMIGVPQWTDQPTNAKFVQDVWGVGVRAKVDGKGIVRREEMESCIREVMDGKKYEEMKKNAMKWSELAREAVSEGGSSDRNIQDFVAKVITNIQGCK